MKAIERVFDTICLIAKIIAAILLGVMLVVSLVEIIRRYIVGQSFPWADELIRYCIVGVAMLGGAAAFRQPGGLVAFDLLINSLKGVPRLVFELLINTISIWFAGFMFLNAYKTITTPSIVKQISIGLQVSMFWPYLPIVLGLALIVLFALERYFMLIGGYLAEKKGLSESGEGGTKA